MDSADCYGANTILAHYGEGSTVQGAVVGPIFQNTLFLFETMDQLLSALGQNPGSPPYTYTRTGNPTVAIAEKKLAALEGTECCRLFGSGMAALSAAAISCLESGSHAVIVDTVYGPIRHFIENYLSRFGVTCSLVSGYSADEVIDAIKPETTLVVLESPSSWLFRLQDVEKIARHCRQVGVTTMIDNTYCTPLYFQPAKLGVDLVCHSATKYIGGHSDVIAGAICGSKERIDKIARDEVSLFGAVLHPFPAWLLTRGMRTLSLRLKQHEETANAIAGWLETRPEIDRVHHIGLPSHPQYALFKQMMKGSTGLFAVETVEQDAAKVKAFCDRLKLFGKGISWGGFESLVIAMPLQPLDYPEKRWIIRLFCGLEDVADLQADLEQALEALRN